MEGAMTRVPGDLQTLCRLARQHEDPSEEERQLVRAKLAARLAGASAAALATSLSANSAAVTTTAAGTGQALAGVAASGANKAVALSGVAAWLGGSVTVGVGVALVVQAMSASPPPVELPAVAASTASVTTAPATTATTTTAPLATVTVAPEAPVGPEIAPVSSGTVEPPAKPTPAARVREAVASPVRDTVNVPLSLEREARALAEVQRALRDGRGSEALTLLAEQDRRYPSGALGAERAAARALALCAAGRFREARPLAERFSRDHARSPLAERVRRKCLDPRGNE
jgi:hypothetical protein